MNPSTVRVTFRAPRTSLGAINYFQIEHVTLSSQEFLPEIFEIVNRYVVLKITNYFGCVIDVVVRRVVRLIRNNEGVRFVVVSLMYCTYQ